MPQEAKLLDPEAFAKLVDRSVETVWKWCREEKIEAHNIGGEGGQARYRIPVSELDKFTITADDLEDELEDDDS
ncbi:MAG: helix-turn-helix domain-containing protein [Bradymonadaceae bacterium]